MKKPKVLLLHGWDWKKYPKFKPTHQWENRQEFLDLLKERYDVSYPELPGFGTEGTYQTAWTLDDYALWLKDTLEKDRYDIVIGYSFGCAVIVHALYIYNMTIPAICVSPAIVRSYQVKTSNFSSQISKLLQHIGLGFVRNFAVNVYLQYIVKNPFYIHGNVFLRATYNNIVRADLSSECSDILKTRSEIRFIFGQDDTATPHQLFLQYVPEAKNLIGLISGAGHNVGATHAKEVVSAIESFNLI